MNEYLDVIKAWASGKTSPQVNVNTEVSLDKKTLQTMLTYLIIVVLVLGGFLAFCMFFVLSQFFKRVSVFTGLLLTISQFML